MLTDAQYKKFFKGYKIVDVVVASEEKLYFLLSWLGRKSDCRIVRGSFSEDGPQWVKNDLYGYDKDRIYMEIAYPDNTLFVLEGDGTYFISPKGTQPNIPYVGQGGPLGGAVSRVRSIGQSQTLALSSAGDVMARDGDENWSRAAPVIDEDKESWVSFHDLDGYALDELYAVGDNGLYYFDGTAWEKMDTPKNNTFSTVCCAPDGFVYAATSEIGNISIYKGRGKEWKKIFEDSKNEKYVNPLNNLVWHDGVLWGSNWSLLAAWKDGNLLQHDGPTGGHLSVRDGVLLCGGVFGGYLHKPDSGWTMLFKGEPVS